MADPNHRPPRPPSSAAGSSRDTGFVPSVLDHFYTGYRSLAAVGRYTDNTGSAASAPDPFADTDILANYLRMIENIRRPPPVRPAGDAEGPPTPGPGSETGLDRRQPMDTSNGGATPTGHGLTQAQMVDSSSAGTNPDDVSRRPDTIGSQRGATDTTGARFDGNDFPPLSDHSINRADPSASPSSSTADTAPAMGESRTTLGERKTKLCLYEFFFYPRSGISCAHGSRCKYAHNLRELRAVTPPIHDILYKATLCPTHMAGAFCAAFTNCPMAHGEEELRVNRFFPRIPDDVHVPLPPAEEPSSSPTYLKDLTTPPHTDKPASSSNNGLPPSLRPDTIDSQRGATDTTGARFDDNDFPPLSDATTSSSSRAGPSSSSSSSSTADTAPAMRDRRTTLCKFWREENKTCTKGDACKNAHGGEELRVLPMAEGPPRPRLCPFWREENKTCTKGSACKNAHGDEELRVVPRAEGWQPSGPCKMFAINGWCRFGANCWYDHGNQELRPGRNP